MTKESGASEPVDIDAPEVHEVDLDNPLRVVLVINGGEESEMEERLMDYVQTFDEVDSFFNAFDETVAVPNQEHIKYEVGSDGLVVMVVDSAQLRDEVLAFIDQYNEGVEQASDEPAAKRQNK